MFRSTVIFLWNPFCTAKKGIYWFPCIFVVQLWRRINSGRVLLNVERQDDSSQEVLVWPGSNYHKPKNALCVLCQLVLLRFVDVFCAATDVSNTLSSVYCSLMVSRLKLFVFLFFFATMDFFFCTYVHVEKLILANLNCFLQWWFRLSPCRCQSRCQLS